jgi:hypothetical protein
LHDFPSSPGLQNGSKMTSKILTLGSLGHPFGEKRTPKGTAKKTKFDMQTSSQNVEKLSPK